MMGYGFEAGRGAVYGHGMMGGFGGAFMIIGMLIILTLAILGIIALVKYLRGYRRVDFTQNDSAMQILNERYAMGEIAEEEYNKKKIELKKF